MKPSPDRLRQIANKYAIGSRPGDRVPMRTGGRELSTETSYCTLRIDFQDTSLPEVTAGHRLLDSQLTSYEDGMDCRDGTSEPPGITDRSFTMAHPSASGCISYSLSEIFCGDLRLRVQGMEKTLTISVSLAILGIRDEKHSLPDYFPYPVEAEHSYPSPGIIFHDQTLRIQHF